MDAPAYALPVPEATRLPAPVARRRALAPHPRVVRRPPPRFRPSPEAAEPMPGLPALAVPSPLPPSISPVRLRRDEGRPATLPAAHRRIAYLQRALDAALADTAELRLRHARLAVRYYSVELARQREAHLPRPQPWYRRLWLAVVGTDVRADDWATAHDS